MKQAAKQPAVKRSKVALIGGSFNPPHVGHVMAAVMARAVFRARDVWLIPAFTHPFGKDLAPYPDRVAMSEAVASRIGPWLTVSRAEERQDSDGTTAQLLKYLRGLHPNTDFTWVMGSDIVPELPKWKNWDQVQALADIVVLSRAGYPAPHAVGPPLPEVSSTRIREAIAHGELPLGLVPQVVGAYIAEHQLYGYTR